MLEESNTNSKYGSTQNGFDKEAKMSNKIYWPCEEVTVKIHHYNKPKNIPTWMRKEQQTQGEVELNWRINLGWHFFGRASSILNFKKPEKFSQSQILQLMHSTNHHMLEHGNHRKKYILN